MLPDEIQTKEFATQSFSKMVYHNQTFRRAICREKTKCIERFKLTVP